MRSAQCISIKGDAVHTGTGAKEHKGKIHKGGGLREPLDICLHVLQVSLHGNWQFLVSKAIHKYQTTGPRGD